MNIAPIGPLQLALCLVFVLIAGLGSLALRLKLGKSLAIGAVRTIAQLYLLGFVLKYVFEWKNPYIIVVVFVWMIFWAAHAVRSRVKEKEVSYFWPIFVSMVLSYFTITVLVTSVVVQVEPWYSPRYFITLGGMIIGNSMNAISLSLDRLFGDLRKRRPEVELILSLGGTYQEATADIFREAIRAGMIPSINSLMTVGLVKLPGMMTGQILGGAAPQLAVKYQIVVMLMLVASTAIGSMLVTSIVRKRCFTDEQQLRLS